MSVTLEYCVVYWKWESTGVRYDTFSEESAAAHAHNLEGFRDAVNSKCEEGWIPSGAADIQFEKHRGAYQAMTRVKTIDRAVVVDAKPVLMAQEVKPVRHSPRLHNN